MMNIKIKLLNDLATVPTKGTRWAAGHDLYAAIPEGKVTIHPEETVLIGTGIAAEIPVTTFGAIFARSGLATKQGLRPANCVGVVDSDYRGEIMVSIYNDSTVDRTVSQGDRIAQLVILPYLVCDMEPTDKLSDTERGNGGFGSTGK
jgi:dUTP pyrophosphatase